ncbi:MAG: 2-oxo acid dehydrogenase subunit E2 [Chloroflexi bacterium]|nr:2-oxo acid dehydrogenase subunit E2 [Chloroflexota bacterium]
MPVPVIMPKFSMTQEEGRVMTLLVAEGAMVEKGEPLLEVETDKVTMEVEAPQSGVLRGVTVKEGDVVPVTAVIAHILLPGEVWADEPVKATPVARRVAAAAGINVNDVPQNTGKVRRQDVEAYLDKVRATPAARRLARAQGVDLTAVNGSGPHGRVQAKDIVGPVVVGPAVEERVGQPVSAMRRTIATRLTHSYQTIPHITFTVSADMTAVTNLRRRLNERGDGAKVSVTAVLVKVCAWALGRQPLVNGSWRDDGIQLHEQANVGVAVALDDGLIVPVVQNAAPLGLAAIAEQVQDLTARARNGRLQPADVQGGTFTISNLGMWGVEQFTAVINPPQSAILAVGRTVKQPVVVETAVGDEVVIRPIMKMTLSVDHRIIDGAVAARFLQDVVAALAQPDRLLW